LTIPSTTQKVTFRPFLVKEQKNLLIAMETQERRDMMRAIVRTIEACVEEPITSELTIFDVDYMFTKIRAKSVGETATLMLGCEECSESSEVSIELERIGLDGEVLGQTVIELTEDISVKMRYPTYQDFMDNEKIFEDTTYTETLLEMLMNCIGSIMTKEEKFTVKDETREELVEFVESMSSEQFEKLTDFVNKIPTITQQAEFKCSSCGHHNDIKLKGMDDFF
jgi:rubrerythrin